MKINEALQKLDPANDDHWTADGFPRVDVVSEVMQAPVTRQEITDAAPDFVRPQPDHEDVEAETPEPEPTLERLGPKDDVEGMAPGEAYVSIPGACTDDWDAGHVEPKDDVVGMAPGEVYVSVELIDTALAEFSRQCVVLARRRDQVARKLIELGKRSALLQKYRDQMTRGTQQDEQRKTIRRYLDGQNRAREERVKRTRRFVDAGVTAQDVAEELGGPSKLDAALSQRKKQRGAGRPVYPRAVER